MTEREARIAFNLVPTIGSVRLAKLAEEAEGSAVAAWEALPEARKRDWEGHPVDWKREIARAEKMGVTLVTEVDDAYPPLLLQNASRPLVLYIVGDPSVLATEGVAVVGTRKPSMYGEEQAEKIARGLAAAGWTVFSGLAAGIDAAAHRGALEAGGKTVGVLGGALDEFFPAENKELARRMADAGGAVVSEFPFGRRPDATTFPQRNRIVAALARGVVAVEAPHKSGTLITCSLALDMGRVVMAVPGRVDARVCAGTNALIREGARLVRSADDVIDDLRPLDEAVPDRAPASRGVVPRKRTARPKPSDAVSAAPAPRVALSAEEAAVLRVIDEDGASVDDVVRACALPVARVNALLVGLRLKKRVRFLPGNRVARAQ